jgi:hypothetical protein
MFDFIGIDRDLRVRMTRSYLDDHEKEFKTTLYHDFVKRFSEEQAEKVIMAALTHVNGVHDNQGNDPFAWAVLLCLSHKCVSRFANDHGITISGEEFKEWLVANKEILREFDGDTDYIGLFAGVFDFLREGGGEE